MVKIEGGVSAADRVASEHDMDNLGEVLPGSGVYHLKHKRLLKRSSLPDQSPLRMSSDPAVKGAEQLRELRRSKRDGEVSREHCFVSTIATEERPSRRCVFPFVYKGVLYQRCTSDHSKNLEQWCAAAVTTEGEVVKGEWGDCDFQNIHCR